ncbi:ankyrin repeat-containing domain protein [Usnea florida]
MKLLDLAPEILAEIIQETVVAVRVGQAFRLRLVCKTFDAQALHAIFTTRVIQECRLCMFGTLGGEVIVPRYLKLRCLAGSEDSNQLISAIRRTAKNLVVGDGEDNQHSFDKNVSALCQAATTHLSYQEVLSLLDPEEIGIDAWTHHNSLRSNAKLDDEADAFAGAAFTGNVVKIHEALASCSDVKRGSRFFGYPLQCACSECHGDIVVILLEHGVKGIRNIPSWKSCTAGFGTPLQSACSGGREDIVGLLLDPKYKLQVSRFEYYDSALRAARGGHSDIVMLLLEKAAPNSLRKVIIKENLENVVAKASRHGQMDFVRTFIEHKSFTATFYEVALKLSLCEAAQHGHLLLVQLLLAQDAKGAYGDLWTPFFNASSRGFERVVRLLLEHGADTTKWPNILFPAASAGQAHIVSFLLENRATLSPQGYGDEAVRALECAMKGGHEAVVRVLNHHGISIEGSPTNEH